MDFESDNTRRSDLSSCKACSIADLIAQASAAKGEGNRRHPAEKVVISFSECEVAWNTQPEPARELCCCQAAST
uniref:Uncharacterized protein n=1 Tax=Arabidopsis thaliana TaxID=3702 RepID=Q8GXY5_ARATH|nr:unknown protein [Arabidopsis thaliana]